MKTRKSRKKCSPFRDFRVFIPRLPRSLFSFAICLLIVFCGACGKIGDPLPPIPRALLTVTDLTVRQQGSLIRLEFPLARPTRARQLARVEIFRLIEANTAPLGLPEDDFASRATVIAAIPADQIPQGLATVSYEDQILPSRNQAQAVAGPVRYRYAVRLIDNDGRGAALSNYATIEPLADLAQPPTDLQAAVTQTEVVIRWTPPQVNVTGVGPANIAGYNLYRRTGEATVKLNAQPLTESRYVDRAFEFGTGYEYIARSLSLPPGNTNQAEAIESDASASLTITPKDTFPPLAPDSIRIASINSLVSLFWPSNAEPDLAGYFIYRSEVEAEPSERWLKLTPRLHTPTTFRDDKVIVGKRYFYQVTAVDIFGNESPRSTAVSEIVNP